MSEQPRRSSGAVLGFLAGAVTVVVLVLLWGVWKRTQDTGRVDLTVAPPAVPAVPKPRLPEAPRIPDAPIPTPK
jgi:hypothetical protein